MLAILTFFWWTRATPHSVEVQKEQELFTEIVLSGLPKLLERWQEGDLEDNFNSPDWSCDELPKNTSMAPAYFQCNPHYMECWARGKTGAPASIPVKLGSKTYQVRLRDVFPAVKTFASGDRHGQWVTRGELGNPIAPWEGLLVEVGVEGNPKSWRMILEDNCHMQELPERRYSYGPRAEHRERVKEMDWDSAGRKIFIDKFLVSRGEVNQWILRAGPPGQQLEDDHTKWALPHTGLSREEKIAYCAFNSKRWMEAHLWDAATMTPSNLKRPFPEYIVKPWLPWARDRRDSFFEKAEDPDWQPQWQDCAQAYVLECAGKFPYQPHASDNVSWLGIYQVLGGEPERFRNPIEANLDIKASRRTLAAKDQGHQLGRRFAEEALPTAFRCYREEFE